MGSVGRKNRHKEQIRKEILQVARQLALEEGWANVSTRRIAEKIEYSTTKIYQEFGSKDEILVELQKIGFRELKQRFANAQGKAQDPEKQLLHISLAQWQFAKENPELYQVMFGLGGVVCAASPSVEMREAGKIVQETLAKITPNYGWSHFVHWWALLHGFVSLDMLNQNNPELQISDFLEESVQRFVAGLKT